MSIRFVLTFLLATTASCSLISKPFKDHDDDDMATSYQPPDFAVAPDLSTIDLARPQGKVGSPCSGNSECAGSSPVCFKSNFFNLAGYPAADGYCSAQCSNDTDCGSGAICVNFAPSIRYCIASCAAATDCRAGYACFEFGCFSDAVLDCDPTMGDGSCTTANRPGGCVRAALGSGNKGTCLPSCAAGVGTCMAGGRCLVVDDTHRVDGMATGDQWKGPVCSGAAGTVVVGAECLVQGQHQYGACVDGAECYLNGANPAGMGFDSAGDNQCRALCYLTGGTPPGGAPSPTCPSMTTCKDVWGLATAAADRRVGLCVP